MTPFTVLLVEDDEVDIMITQRAWEKNNISNPLRVVHDGAEGLDYLLRRGDYENEESAPRPGVVLLDINMPRMNGLELLKALRASRNLAVRCLPVVMLTSSEAERDRMESYHLGANAYVVKPDNFENFVEAMRTIDAFWSLVETNNGTQRWVSSHA